MRFVRFIECSEHQFGLSMNGHFPGLNRRKSAPETVNYFFIRDASTQRQHLRKFCIACFKPSHHRR
jgi:hypothetical protein